MEGRLKKIGLFALLWFCPTLMLIGAFYIGSDLFSWIGGYYQDIAVPIMIGLFFAIIEYRRIARYIEETKN
jgi:hypothetical protein